MDKLIDKLPPPALNRPPTQQRVPDPGRFRSIDMQPENALKDPSYKRMVQDIEALQHRQGWLAGRGAFDKEDLLYLRDREEQQRMAEQEQRDTEAAAYAAARAHIERGQEAAARAMLRQQQPAKQQRSKSAQNRGTVPVAKVEAHHSREQKQQQQHPAGQSVQPEQAEQRQERDHKRPRLEDTGRAAAGATAVPAASRIHATASSNTATCSRASNSTQRSGQSQQQGRQQSSREEHMGLEGLLGYSSESDDEEDATPGSTCQAASIPHQGLKLPSAAELLEQDLPSSFARDPSSTAADMDDAPVPVVGSGATYEHRTGWI